jgi:hypothetical protein
MSDHEHHYPDPVPSDGYEKLDAHLGPLVKFLVWLAISTTVILIAMWALLEAYKKMPLPEASTERHPLAAARQIPLDPRLEALKAPHVDVHGNLLSQEGGPYFNTRTWKHWQAKWADDLSTYGWIDPTAKIVRVPIERAMELQLSKGFPTSAKPRD